MSSSKLSWTTALLGVLFTAAPLVASAQSWPTGHVYQGTGGSPFGVIDVTPGGNVGANITPLPGRNPGQLAWSLDGATLFASQFDTGNVVAVTAAGAVTTFATGISGPTGLLMTRDGHLLVVSFNLNKVLDITAGGNFSAAAAFATGFDGGRNLVQLADGRVLLAAQGSGTVFDIHYPTGGTATAFATGLGNIGDLVQDPAGNLYVSQYNANKVTNIRAGGNLSAAPAFATGKTFMGLALDSQGRLLASELTGTNVYNISSGGDFSAAAAFATNAGSGETALDTVPRLDHAVVVTAEPMGTNCAQGGVRITTCVDSSGNASCEAGELVLDTQFVCNGTSGAEVVVTTTDIGPGTDCANGGTRIDAGLDNGDGGGTAGNGTLEAGEIDSTAFACDGTDGMSGTDGTNGNGALVSTTPVAKGEECKAGGVQIVAGIDNGDGGGTAGNGVLEAGEIDSTSLLCNGEDGSGGCATTRGTGGVSMLCVTAVLVVLGRRRRR